MDTSAEPMTVVGYGYACGFCGLKIQGFTRENERFIREHIRHHKGQKDGRRIHDEVD